VNTTLWPLLAVYILSTVSSVYYAIKLAAHYGFPEKIQYAALTVACFFPVFNTFAVIQGFRRGRGWL
jgi:hypothetical protein